MMKPFPLDDPRWKALDGAYRRTYDASTALSNLNKGERIEEVWKELWNELHHQGDVGEASYAAVPALVMICRQRDLLDWNLFALAATIETCRERPSNPPLPNWLKKDYDAAWQQLFALGLDALRHTQDPLLVKSILAVIALHKELRVLGEVIDGLDESELLEVRNNYIR